MNKLNLKSFYGKKITICGASHFINDSEFKEKINNIELWFSLNGIVVHKYPYLIQNDNVELDDKYIKKLDMLFLYKIDDSKILFVVNDKDKIDNKTQNFIDYANIRGKEIYYLSDMINDYENWKNEFFPIKNNRTIK